MSRPILPTCKTRNWPACNDARKRRGSLTIWFDPAMSREAAPAGRRGRQPVCSDAAIQACLAMKVLLGLPPRQATGFVESLLQKAGVDRAVPELPGQIPPGQEIASVTADGAFDTRKCHDALAARGARGCDRSARRNAGPWRPDTAGALGIVLGPMADNASPRNEIPRASKRIGRAIRRRWSGCHRRSRVEI